MQLGDVIRQLQDEEVAAQALQSLGDLALFARIAETAATFDESPGEYVAASVGRFAASADNEAWLRLIGDVERTADPGAAALKRMLHWALDTDAREVATAGVSASGCGCGSGGGMRHEPG